MTTDENGDGMAKVKDYARSTQDILDFGEGLPSLELYDADLASVMCCTFTADKPESEDELEPVDPLGPVDPVAPVEGGRRRMDDSEDSESDSSDSEKSEESEESESSESAESSDSSDDEPAEDDDAVRRLLSQN